MTEPHDTDQLRPYQQEAIEAITAGLAGGGRGQLLAACGTGKTLLGAHAAIRLCPPGGLVVIACPSLALIAQTLAAWNQAGVDHQPLAVCSDESVADTAVHVDDLPCPVTTDPAAITAWLRRPGPLRLLATTHLSAHQVGAGLLAAGQAADLLIIDEAHHTAGIKGKHSTLMHRDTALPAARRLYMTATPRLLSAGVGYRSPGAEVGASMDDPDIFGPVLYRYPFSRGIAERWLDDYRVAVIGVTRPEVLAILKQLAPDAVHTTDPTPALRTMVVQAALARAAVEFGVRRTLVFTPRIAEASEFARTLPATVRLLPDAARPPGPLTAGHVHGGMNVHQRGYHMAALADPPGDGWTVLANARCLGEGVDVPAVDCVVFTRPKKSTTDVVQAVGRALRRHPDGHSTATVLVPVLLPEDPNADVDFDDPQYETLWQVVRALRAHDDVLAAKLDLERLRASSGPTALPSRIVVRLPDGYDADHLLSCIRLRLITATTSPWFDGLRAAHDYHAEHGHLRMLANYIAPDGYLLGNWITKQRTAYNRNHLGADRIAELEKLGMIWDENDLRWREALARLVTFREQHGHLRVPQMYTSPDGYRLGQWVSNLRIQRKANTPALTATRVTELDELGFLWEDTDWERGLAGARTFHAEHGHLRVPADYVSDSGVNLKHWIQTKRRDHRRGTLAADRIAALDQLGIVWEPFAVHWDRGLAAAAAFHAEHGHLQVPRGYVDASGFVLETWILNRRADRRAGRLADHKIKALDALGMDWSPHDTDWERGLAAARAFYAEHGHLKVPTQHRQDGVQLHAWVIRRRKEFHLNRLPQERQAALDSIGMIWRRGGQRNRPDLQP